MMTLEVREAQLANNESDKNTLTGNVVQLVITGTLPIIDVSDKIITRSKIIETTYVNTNSRKNSNNTIVDTVYKDAKGVDRFIFLTSFTSGISDMYMRAYYDRKYSDIILIPELEYISQTILTNKYKLYGYRVGGGEDRNEVQSDPILPVTRTFKLPETNEDINNNYYSCKIHGLNNGSHNGAWITIASDYSVNDKKYTPVGLLSLGSMTDVFVKSVDIPAYTLFQAGHDRYLIKYFGNRQPGSIYIPISF
jgi:hypothetical protein